jgi:hypothetical protein
MRHWTEAQGNINKDHQEIIKSFYVDIGDESPIPAASNKKNTFAKYKFKSIKNPLKKIIPRISDKILKMSMLIIFHNIITKNIKLTAKRFGDLLLNLFQHKT